MAKTAAEWEAKPKFPATHYVDSRVYTDEAIFLQSREQAKVRGRQYANIVTESRERLRQRLRDIGKAPGLRERDDLACR